jgi:hypothetical protein
MPSAHLPDIVNLGDTITVTKASGGKLTGSIADMSPSSISVLAGGTRHSLAEADIKTISRQKQASVAAGARRGLLIGAGLGIFAVASSGGYAYDGKFAYMMIAGVLYGGIGSGIGAGIAGLNTRTQVIYSGDPSRVTLSVSPVLSRARKGVSLSMRF